MLTCKLSRLWLPDTIAVTHHSTVSYFISAVKKPVVHLVVHDLWKQQQGGVVVVTHYTQTLVSNHECHVYYDGHDLAILSEITKEL